MWKSLENHSPGSQRKRPENKQNTILSEAEPGLRNRLNCLTVVGVHVGYVKSISYAY